MLPDTGDAWLVESTHGDMIRPCGARLNEGERLMRADGAGRTTRVLR